MLIFICTVYLYAKIDFNRNSHASIASQTDPNATLLFFVHSQVNPGGEGEDLGEHHIIRLYHLV